MIVARFFGYLIIMIGGVSAFLAGPCVIFAGLTGGTMDRDKPYFMWGLGLFIAGIALMKVGGKIAIAGLRPATSEANSIATDKVKENIVANVGIPMEDLKADGEQLEKAAESAATPSYPQPKTGASIFPATVGILIILLALVMMNVDLSHAKNAKEVIADIVRYWWLIGIGIALCVFFWRKKSGGGGRDEYR
jgi:hypothetical protein